VTHISPPWDEPTVDALNAYQHAGVMHPFTCGLNSAHPVLVATPSGWICANDEPCDYQQTWAHAFMTSPAAITPPSWQRP
jgi:hypothetical protein